MNEPSSALRMAAIEVAARAIQTAKLQEIGRRWRFDEHRLDLVTTLEDGILASVEARAVAYGSPKPGPR
jgi:hypothetical protein